MRNTTAGVWITRRVRTHLAVTSVSVTKDTQHTAPNVWVSSLTLDDIISVLLSHYLWLFMSDFLVLILTDKCKKLNSLKHPVRTTVAGSHN